MALSKYELKVRTAFKAQNGTFEDFSGWLKEYRNKTTPTTTTTPTPTPTTTPTTTPTPTTPTTTTDKIPVGPGILPEIGTALQTRGNNIKNIFGNYKSDLLQSLKNVSKAKKQNGTQGELLQWAKEVSNFFKSELTGTDLKNKPKNSYSAQIGGQVAGGIGDTIWEGIENSLQTITPDSVQQGIMHGIQSLGNTSIVKSLGKSWEHFKNNNPERAKNLEGVLNISTILPTGKVVGGIGKTLEIGGNKLAKSGIKRITKNTQNFLKDKLVKPNTKGEKLSQVLSQDIQRKGGFFSNKTVNLNKRQHSILNELIKIPGIKTNMLVQDIINIAGKKVDTLNKNLKSLLKENLVNIDPKEVKKGFNNLVNTIKKEPLLVGDEIKSATNLINKFKEFVKGEASTNLGLHLARQKYDKWIKTYTNVYKGKENSLSIANKNIRQYVNDTIDNSTKNVEVHKFNKEQSLLLQGREILAPQALKEGQSPFLSKLKQIHNKFPLKSEIALGVGAVGASMAGVLPIIATGLLGGATIKTIFKGVTNPTIHKLLGKALKEIGQMPVTSELMGIKKQIEEYQKQLDSNK